MAQQGGLGRGLASLIPQKKAKQEMESGEIKGTDEEQSYFGSVNEQREIKSYPLAKTTTEIVEKESLLKNKIEAIKKDKNPTKNSTKNKTKRNENKEIEKKFKEGVELISVDMIIPNPHQPRVRFSESRLAELADSITEHGVIQPLIVTSVGGGNYELIAGERRLEAAKIAGLEKVPVIVKDVNDQKKAEWALVENVQRHDLNAMEEARAYKKMQENFGMTQEDIAVRVGKSRSTIANSLRLLNLPIEIQRALMDEKISEGHAKTILGVSNPEKQRALFELILKESLNVRQTEMKVRDVLGNNLRKKRSDLDPETYSKQEELAQSLGTKVEIRKSMRGGKIVIDFYSEEEFDALLSNLIS